MKKKFTIAAFIFGIATIICGLIVLYSWGTIDISLAIVPLLFFLACVHWVSAIEKNEKKESEKKSV